MLALSDLEVDSVVTRIEQLYRELKPKLSAKNSVQTLTQILVIGDSGPEDSIRLDIGITKLNIAMMIK